jgi:hypothetical protein
MKTDNPEYYTDITRDTFDPELFAAALAVQRINRLVMQGGSLYGSLDDEDSLCPEHFERFVPCALEYAQKMSHFTSHWHRLQQALPLLKAAWEKGRILFQEDLTHAVGEQEQMEYFSMIDFAVDCYARISAKNTYPDNSMMQAWAINGYMVAWREHFLKDLEEEDFIGHTQ